MTRCIAKRVRGFVVWIVSPLALASVALAAPLSAPPAAVAEVVRQAENASPSPSADTARHDRRPAQRSDEAAASAAARSSRHRVEVTGSRTGTETVYANPDGSFTVEQRSRPVRVRRGDDWVPVDPSLRRASDGSVTPGATTTGLRFSGGGTAPLATMSGGTWSMSLAWPAALPTPSLSGETATYRDVLPGVDLLVTASNDGFSERLVVTSRSAAADPALREVAFSLRSTGVSVLAGGDGGLVGRDEGGETVFTAPPPLMWDTAVSPGAPPRQARVGLTLRDGTLTLRPDLSFLRDPATRFPVTIDPSFSGKRLDWTTVLAGSPGVSFWNGQNLADSANGKVMVGYETEQYTLARSFFRMDTSGVRGKHILNAKFQITEKWSWSCQARPVQLWHVGVINSGTTWNSQPQWIRQLGEADVAKGNENYGCGDGSVEFDVTSAVRDASGSGRADLTLGLRAANESDAYGWKRFDDNPVLAITYNTVPDAPSGLTVDGKPCGSGTYVGTTTPTLRAKASDPDAGQTLDVSAYWATPGSATNGTDKVTQTNVANGGQLVVSVPAGRLTDGQSYYWQAQSTDRTDTSPWSGQCAFTVDATRPGSPPTVTSADYPADGGFHGGKGKTGIFTLGAAGVSDVTSYLYGWADPPTTAVDAGTLGGTATVSATPPGEGINTLYVRSRDRAGNLSDISKYVFYAGSANGPVGSWIPDDGGGSGTTLTDTSGNGRTATLSGGAQWSAGRLRTAGTAISFDGTTGYAATDGPVVHTDQSFTVSAWVRLTSAAKWATVLCQEGGTNSGLLLQYDQPGNRWSLTAQTADTADPPAVRAGSTAPRTGVWTHLLGTYDAGAGELRLYVDGVLSGTAPVRIGWNAGGRLLIGTEKFNGKLISYFPGDIADVRVWDRVVDASEARALATAPTLVGAWNLDGAGEDASGYGRPFATSGGATWTGGHNGSGGVSFNGTDGYAETSGPVLHTDESFTVAAWVRLTTTSTSGRWVTAVSQNGAAFSAFVLSYNGSQWAFALHASDVDDPAKWRVAADQPVQAGVWTHLAGVYDAGTREMRLYVNGRLAASTTGAAPFDAARTLDLGRARVSSAWGDRWPGDVDDVRAYQGVLSDQQIVTLFNE
ncbi:hypothetical protein Msi02_32320 [Microbispora siamensis]|uniref:LamG-like jellyroll fold domain-containing protein n=1 Tax=Microbispora siamensis TaxID=564413 RepID=A0ABQ4GLW6_9ACTN|nr:hypothetical protein Msi02_32320 [Microbispora siamensis]